MSHEKAARGRSKEKSSTQSHVRSRIPICSFNLLSIVAPSGHDQTVRLPASTTRTVM